VATTADACHPVLLNAGREGQQQKEENEANPGVFDTHNKVSFLIVSHLQFPFVLPVPGDYKTVSSYWFKMAIWNLLLKSSDLMSR
jgi:hypothetical protein